MTLQAKKRHLIEKRLQTKLRKETDSVRRAEEAKKNKNSANRKEEDLQLKDSIVRHPLLSFDFATRTHFNFSVQAPTNTAPAPRQFLANVR